MLAVQRAADAQARLGHDMRVDHRRADITMTEQLLHATNIRAGFQEMRGKAVPQGVAARRLGKVTRQALATCSRNRGSPEPAAAGEDFGGSTGRGGNCGIARAPVRCSMAIQPAIRRNSFASMTPEA